MERWFLDNPMAVGAAVLVAGAAFGATLPRTSQEDALMGASRERVIEAATDAAHQAAQAIGLLGNDVGGRSTASKSLSSSHT